MRHTAYGILITGLLLFCVGEAKDIYAPVPQSEILFPKNEPKLDFTIHHFLELQVSSWFPDQLSQPSYLANTSAFSSASPQFSLLLGSLRHQETWYKLSGLFGFSYEQLQRTGTLGYDINSFRITQYLNLYQAQLGLEFMLTPPSSQNLHPLGRLSLTPTWSQSPSSEFNDGVNTMDWLARASIGISWNLPTVASWLHLEAAALELGAEGTKNINTTTFTGTGLWIATRVGWE